MEHTVLAYIDRLSTQQLEHFLEQFYEDAFQEDFSGYVPYIEYELDRRKKRKPINHTPPELPAGCQTVKQ